MKQKKTILEKTTGIFAWISLFLAVVMSATMIFASLSSEEGGKEIFGYRALIVASGSMSKSELSENEEIFFDAGDLIIIKSVEDFEALKEGDVITFLSYNPESYGKIVTHKIRQIKYSFDGSVSGFVTYGINTGSNDTTVVAPQNVIGKYFFKLPMIGKLFNFSKTSRGYYLSILIPSVLLIIFFSVRVGKSLGKQDIGKDYGEEIEILKRRLTALEEDYAAKISECASSQYAQNYSFDNVAEATPARKAGAGGAKFEKDTENLELEQVLEGSEIERLTESDELEPLAESTELEQSLEKGEFHSGAGVDTEGLSIPRGRKVSFSSKLLRLSDNVQDFFDILHEELVSFKRVNARLSFRCISYRFGRRLIAKMTVCGKTLKLHLCLNVSEFNERVFFQKDLSSLKAYEQVPFTVKIKSARGLNNAITLINALAEKLELVRDNNLKQIKNIFIGGNE